MREEYLEFVLVYIKIAILLSIKLLPYSLINLYLLGSFKVQVLLQTLVLDLEIIRSYS